MKISLNSFKSKQSLKVGPKEYAIFSLPEAAKNGLGDIARLPKSLKVLLENLLRNEDGVAVKKEDVQAISTWLKNKSLEHEIAYHPVRVLMQDFTGVPAVVDLAVMRDAMIKMGGDPQKINPLSQVDLVIDHSVSVDKFGTASAFQENVDLEMERNAERYAFLRWGQKSFKNFRVVPPGTGICHQVNVEYLAQTVWSHEHKGETYAYPDTLVGTDSHTTMVNGLAVLGWGVGGIEAEAAMLGQPVSMLIPDVVGFKLTGKLKEGTTATDLVLYVVEALRKKGVVGKFVEFFGPGLDHLSLADRATIANMAPEYGATCGFFPIDQETLNYLKFTGRSSERVELVKAYAQAQGLWRDSNEADPLFTSTLELDISTVEPCMAGPKRPQDKILLSQIPQSFVKALPELKVEGTKEAVPVGGANYELKNGHVVIAAITSCTNTSNPAVLMAAGLLAKKAVEKGLMTKPWVKTSLAPGSQVVTEYLQKAGFQKYLDTLGFQLVGYGCTTCIGNSGPLPEKIGQAVDDGKLVVSSVLSGNRNFEGRISPQVRSNYLASPPLVVAYALAGSMLVDLYKDPIGMDKDGKAVYLKDIWPSNQEIQSAMEQFLLPEMFTQKYADVFTGPKVWQDIPAKDSLTYNWDAKSTYIKCPPYFDGMDKKPGKPADIKGASVLALLGDSITTDHISPAGSIKEKSPAGAYLSSHAVTYADFNSYGARRGNHEVMMRGTFANTRLRNEMLDGVEGGFSRYQGEGETLSIYDAAMKYKAQNIPLVIFAGKEYGTGSSRDWAAKGTNLLGVKAVVAESFERIHRSNLIGMGVMPLEFTNGQTRKTLQLQGDEKIDLLGLGDGLKPGMSVKCVITRKNGERIETNLKARVDTLNEVDYFVHGGILQYVLRQLF